MPSDQLSYPSPTPLLVFDRPYLSKATIMPAAARLLLFCALLSASASSMGMTIYKTVDNTGVVSYSDRYSPGRKPSS